MTPNMLSMERKIIDLTAMDMMSIESVGGIQKFSEIDVKNQIVKTTLMNFDDISRNDSLYERNSIINAIKSPYIEELLRRGAFWIELGHPPVNCDKMRFFTIDMDNICGKVVNYDIGKDGITGKVQFVKPKGPIVWDWVEKDTNVSFSIRIFTPNYKLKDKTDGSGKKYTHKFGTMQLISFDCVTIPGYRAASIADDTTYDARNVIPNSSVPSEESFKGISLQWESQRKKDEMIHLIKSQETFDIMQNIYGFEINVGDNISYSEEGFLTIQLDKGRSMKIGTDIIKINQILGASL